MLASVEARILNKRRRVDELVRSGELLAEDISTNGACASPAQATVATPSSASPAPGRERADDSPGTIATGRAVSESGELHAVAEALHRRFDDATGAARVDDEIELAIADYAHARIRTYVPVLVERRVTERLRSHRRGR